MRNKHFFILPWVAAIDLYSISAIGLDSKQCMTAQLYGGGFQRGPVDPCTPGVIVEIITALENLEGVEVTRSSLCAAEFAPTHRTIPMEIG